MKPVIGWLCKCKRHSKQNQEDSFKQVVIVNAREVINGVLLYFSSGVITSLAVQFYVDFCTKSGMLATGLLVARGCVSHCRLMTIE